MNHLPSRRVPKAPGQEQHRHDKAWKGYGASNIVKGESPEYAGQGHEQRPDDQEAESYSCAPRRVVCISYSNRDREGRQPQDEKGRCHEPTVSPPSVVAHGVESRVVFGFEEVECDANGRVVRRADEHDPSKDRRITVDIWSTGPTQRMSERYLLDGNATQWLHERRDH